MFQNSGATGHQGHHDEESEPVGVGGRDAEVIDLAAERAKRVPGEVEKEEGDVEAFCMAVEGASDEEAKEKARQMLVERLKGAVDSWARVEFLSKVADWGCLDSIVGVVFPEVGDVGAAAVEIGYLLGEAKLAKMRLKGQTKIVAYELVDMAIGLVPVLGDAGDLVFMANRMSAKEFRANVEQKAQEALAAGVPRERVDEVLARHEALMSKIKLVDQVVSLQKKAGGGVAPGGGASTGSAPTESAGPTAAAA